MTTETAPLVTSVDFVGIPAQDFEVMTTFYGETLGLPFVKRWATRDGAEHQAGNLTLAIMRSQDFDSGVCLQAICLDPDGNPISLHRRYAP